MHTCMASCMQIFAVVGPLGAKRQAMKWIITSYIPQVSENRRWGAQYTLQHIAQTGPPMFTIFSPHLAKVLGMSREQLKEMSHLLALNEKNAAKSEDPETHRFGDCTCAARASDVYGGWNIACKLWRKLWSHMLSCMTANTEIKFMWHFLYRAVGAPPVPARALCTHFTRNAHKLRQKKMTHVVKTAFIYHKQQSNQNLQLVRGKTLIPLDKSFCSMLR